LQQLEWHHGEIAGEEHGGFPDKINRRLRETAAAGQGEIPGNMVPG
jgi:hypothetical protein